MHYSVLSSSLLLDKRITPNLCFQFAFQQLPVCVCERCGRSRFVLRVVSIVEVDRLLCDLDQASLWKQATGAGRPRSVPRVVRFSFCFSVGRRGRVGSPLRPQGPPSGRGVSPRALGSPSGRGVPPQAVPACAPVRRCEDVRAAVCRAVPGSPSTATLAVLRPWPASPAPGADGSSSRGCRLSGSALGPETRVPDLGTTPRKTAPGRVDCLNADAPPAGPAAQARPHGPSGAPSRSPRCSRVCRGPCLRDGL